MPLSDYPGFASFAPELQTQLRRLEDGDESERRVVLERVADSLNVLIGLELLQFVFVGPPAAAGDAPDAPIDLIAPPEEPAESIAWFSVDEAGYDEYRDAVTLFGDLSGVLGAPIILDVDEEEPGEVY